MGLSLGVSLVETAEMTHSAPPKPAIRKAACSKCGGFRNCDIRGEYRESYVDEKLFVPPSPIR